MDVSRSVDSAPRRAENSPGTILTLRQAVARDSSRIRDTVSVDKLTQQQNAKLPQRSLSLFSAIFARLATTGEPSERLDDPGIARGTKMAKLDTSTSSLSDVAIGCRLSRRPINALDSLVARGWFVRRSCDETVCPSLSDAPIGGSNFFVGYFSSNSFTQNFGNSLTDRPIGTYEETLRRIVVGGNGEYLSFPFTFRYFETNWGEKCRDLHIHIYSNCRQAKSISAQNGNVACFRHVCCSFALRKVTWFRGERIIGKAQEF